MEKRVGRNGRLLLLGPAGAGKSHRLLAALVEALRADSRQEALLLLPTVSYRDHTRNLVLRESDLRGFSGASICTFEDLLRRLVPEAASGEISAARQELLVRRLLGELRLPDFGRVADFPGFRASLAEAAEEVRRAGITAEELEGALSAGRAPTAAAAGNPLQPRHRSFLTFLRAYNTALEQAGADAGARLARALDAIHAGALCPALLLVDGFADFTREQRQLLEALLPHAGAVQVALTLDPTRRGFFYQAERSRAWLESKGFREEWLVGNRRAHAGSLAQVERTLCEGRAEPPPPLFGPDGALTLLAAADRRDEVELVGRQVLLLARGGHFRYRDIGIIARRPADYAPLFRDIFRRLGIPPVSYTHLTLPTNREV